MKTSTFIILVCLVASTLSEAAPSSKGTPRKPSQAEAGPTQVKVVYGDKISSFVISKTEKGGFVTAQDNSGRNSSREINAKDLSFLNEEFAKVKAPGNELRFCTRSYIELQNTQKKVIGCLGSKNKTARSLSDLANFLNMLL